MRLIGDTEWALTGMALAGVFGLFTLFYSITFTIRAEKVDGAITNVVNLVDWHFIRADKITYSYRVLLEPDRERRAFFAGECQLKEMPVPLLDCVGSELEFSLIRTRLTRGDTVSAYVDIEGQNITSYPGPPLAMMISGFLALIVSLWYFWFGFRHDIIDVRDSWRTNSERHRDP